jgi:hypothetical protein
VYRVSLAAPGWRRAGPDCRPASVWRRWAGHTSALALAGGPAGYARRLPARVADGRSRCCCWHGRHRSPADSDRLCRPADSPGPV